MNHLEGLITEWLEFDGYFVKKNIKVGKLGHGGYGGELEVVAYHPDKRRLLHVETSQDSLTWENKEKKFARQFKNGKEFIPKLFPWLDGRLALEQWAVISASNKNHPTVGGGKVVPYTDLVLAIMFELDRKKSQTGNITVPETYPMLRTIQLVQGATKKAKGSDDAQEWKQLLA